MNLCGKRARVICNCGQVTQIDGAGFVRIVERWFNTTGSTQLKQLVQTRSPQGIRGTACAWLLPGCRRSQSKIGWCLDQVYWAAAHSHVTAGLVLVDLILLVVLPANVAMNC